MDIFKKETMHTETEIFQQPDVWIKIFELVKGMSGSLSQFLSPILSDKNASILLTGAGSSAFIGEALQLPIARARLSHNRLTNNGFGHPP